MIIFKRLSWKNFLSTGNVPIEIFLNSSQNTLIVGKNGAGKSTILDALTFALFGKPFRKIGKNGLINSINGKDCLVEVDFQIGTNEYTIRRGIKPNLFDIEMNGVPLNQSAAITDFQVHLESNILRLNYKSFTQIVILGSRAFVPFMQLSAGDRRVIIEDLLDITIFSSMNKILKGKVDALNEEVTKTDSQIRYCSEKITLQEGYITTLESQNQSVVQQKQNEIDELDALIQQLNVHINASNEKIDELESGIVDKDEVRAKIAKLKSFDIKIETNKDRKCRELDFFHDTAECPSCKQTIGSEHKQNMEGTLEKDIEDLSVTLNRLHEDLKKYTDRLVEINETMDEISDIKNHILSESNKRQMYRDRKLKLNAEISSSILNDSVLTEQKDVLDGFRQELSQAQACRLAQEKTKRYNDIATSLLKDSGIKTKIIKQYLPVINKLINKYLQELDFFVNFTLDENFKEEIKSRYRDTFVYGNFSEGQKMRIDLALLFTWREVARMKNSVNTNLLFLDEIFDSSLDTEGTDNFMRLMKMSGENVNTFIISHKADQLYDKFNTVMEFTLKNNFTEVEIVSEKGNA